MLRHSMTFVVLGACLGAAFGGEIRWQSGTYATPLSGPEQAAATIAQIAGARGGTEPARLVVQFDGPIDLTQRNALAAAGLDLQDYLGDFAYFARVAPEGVRPDLLAAQRSLQVVLPIQTAWKLHPSYLTGEVPSWSVVAPGAENEAAAGEMVVAAYVAFHRDVDLGQAKSLVERYGGWVRAPMRSINALVVELPLSAIPTLAAEGGVKYIEPPLPLFETNNNSNRTLVGAGLAQSPPYGLDGSGVRALIYDGGTIKSDHADLVGRVHIGDEPHLADHATHVAGTLGGTGAASSGLYRGMAPAVLIDSYEFEVPGGLSAGFLYTNPGDLEADYTASITQWGAHLSSNSIGSNVARNGFPCSWEGNYGDTSALIDASVRGSLGAPFRIVWAGGNERGSGTCGTNYNTVAPPSGAKNHLSIGAVNSNNDTVTSFTSWGPTDDGRLKPDFCAPGCQSDDDLGVTSCSSSGAYATYCGTSMATPTMAGLCALFLQDYRANFPLLDDPRNSTLKALFAHTAVDLDSAGPDFKTGYGSVRIVPALEQMRSGNWLEDVVAQGSSIQVLVVVQPGDPYLKVTIAWDDYPGTPNVIPTLVNDLDLLVREPNLAPHYPWTLDPASPAAAAVQTVPDHRNNIEQVYIPNPAPGTYLVEITGFNVPEGPQPVSIVGSPSLIKCTTRGKVDFERPQYPCQGPVKITVNDCDLNLDPNAIETVTVQIASTSEPAGESVLLTETSAETALFQGMIATDTTDAAGVLWVAEGDTITVTYIDADDGFGGTNVTVTDQASIDCTPPVIGNIQVPSIQPRDARVTFTTNEPARVQVRYGTACGDLTQVVGSSTLKTVHDYTLAPLNDATTYFFVIEALDAAGNPAVADNGGACYSFATPEIPEYFTELFAGFDLDNSSLLLAPNSSVDYYAGCRFETTVLPTDPTGGTPLALTDNGSAAINLSGGHAVLLYGQSYSQFFVNANGTLTFTSADSDSTESIADHFNQPRISVLWDDLDPTEGGQVSWRELGDRVAITWFEIPENGLGDVNTFQAELFYDGRIQLTWLEVDSNDNLVGLSPGGGQPALFYQTSLSDLPACGPRPPSAAGRTVTLGTGRSATISLLASDDGDPPVPGALTYVLLSLPGQGLRDAGNDHLITPAELPYMLAGGGNQLTYAAPQGFLGEESFQFKVNDGGVPPTGGDSNVATMIIVVEPILMLPFFDDFAQPEPDSQRWVTNHGVTVDDVGLNEPSPPYAARLNGYPSGRDELITSLLDLSGYPAARLRFYWQRTGGGESPDIGDNLWVEYLNAGGAWVTLDQFAGDGPDLTTFYLAQYNLPAEALHDSFRLRFRTKGTASVSYPDDWFIDDVLISLPGAPVAYSRSIRVREGEPTLLELMASDPNDRPLTYIITSLPTHGALSDPGAGPIESGDLPYALVSQGGAVLYTPQSSYIGADALSFHVTNGTHLSNSATTSMVIEPVLHIPFYDPFAALAFDPTAWALVNGATIETFGLKKPTPPYAVRLNASPNKGDVLMSYAIDLEGLTDVRLDYYWERTGDGDSPEAGDDLFVDYLDSSGMWVNLATYLGADADMTGFALASHLLPPEALHRDFRVRFTSKSTATTVSDDWFIDDVLVYSEHAPSATGQFVGLARHEWADVTLVGFDPEAAPLTYVIATLPTHGVLIDRLTNIVVTPADLPHALAAGGNVVRYVPEFTYEGTDGFAFYVSDGQFVSLAATVSIQIGGVQPIHFFPLDTDPGWSTQGLWAWGVPQGLQFDPPTGYTGTHVYGYNLAGFYENELPARTLTSTPLNCAQVTNAELRFYRWLGVEDAMFDHAKVEVSHDGVNWTLVWDHTGGNLNETAWSLQTYDISTTADRQATVHLRWTMGPTDDSAAYSGWNLDDIGIWGRRVAPVGDMDVDGDLDASDLAAFLIAYFSCEGEPAYDPAADLNGDGCVTLADYFQWQAAYREYIGNPTAPLPGRGLGDGNADGRFDATDLPFLSACIAGPDVPASGSCAAAFDLDRDGDVDTADMSVLLTIFPH